MNQKLQESIASSINELLEMLRSTKSFALEQAPEIAREIVRFGIIKSALGVCIGICFIGLSIFSCYKWKNWTPKGTYDCCGWLPVWIISALVSIPFVLINGYFLTMSLVAPKLYILDYLADMIGRPLPPH